MKSTRPLCAAWRAIVAEGKIAEWQVYADNKPVYELLADARSGSANVKSEL